MLDGISLGGGTDLGGGAGDDPDARAVAAVNASTNAAPSEARRGLTRSFTSIGSSSFQIFARDEATRRPPADGFACALDAIRSRGLPVCCGAMRTRRRFPIASTAACLVALGTLWTRPALAAESAVDPIVPLLLGLSIVLGAAKVAGWLASHMGQPAVLGELVAGILIGNLWVF